MIGQVVKILFLFLNIASLSGIAQIIQGKKFCNSHLMEI